jgi:hypothetical protein
MARELTGQLGADAGRCAGDQRTRPTSWPSMRSGSSLIFVRVTMRIPPRSVETPS